MKSEELGRKTSGGRHRAEEVGLKTWFYPFSSALSLRIFSPKPQALSLQPEVFRPKIFAELFGGCGVGIARLHSQLFTVHSSQAKSKTISRRNEGAIAA
ncbi:MAG: hypothetical protein HY774_23485 [Acidobacteria bacterium]|nr:hypothetical protein [Acidobacteriota bacterium]